MEEFDFYQDMKITCWERACFTIKAQTYEDAVKMIASWKGKDVLGFVDDKTVIFNSNETLYDTSELVHVQNNDGQPTIEIYDCKDNLLSDNTRYTKEA